MRRRGLKLFGVLASYLIIVAFFRAVNGAGPVDVRSILDHLKHITFNLFDVTEHISFFASGEFQGYFAWNWDSSNNFIDNIDSFFKNYVTVIGKALWVILQILWTFVVDALVLLGSLLDSLLTILGFKAYIN